MAEKRRQPATRKPRAKAAPRRRISGPRRRPRWSAWLAGLLMLNFYCGMFFSPITGATGVRVVGADPTDRARIERHLQTLAGKPAWRNDRMRLESLILQNDAVLSAELSQNPFGRGLLKLRLRKPVARIVADRIVLLASDGTIFSATNAPARLPLLRLPSKTLEPNLALMGGWEATRTAGLSAQLSDKFPRQNWSIDVDQRGVICLNKGVRGSVVLGSSDALDRKLERLRQILKDRPSLLSQVAELNLTSPANPVYVPLAASRDESIPK